MRFVLGFGAFRCPRALGGKQDRNPPSSLELVAQ